MNDHQPPRLLAWAVLAIIVLWFLVAAAAFGARVSHAGIPETCRQYQRHLTSEATNTFGPNAPVAVLAAQIQQESGCRPDATSQVGAQGLTQFMPATARDMARRYPRDLGPADPMNWRWAISAQVRYMNDLVSKPWRTECDTWAAKLASYNGGEGWLRRDQAVCRARDWSMVERCGPCVTNRWFGNVELTPDTRRSPANIRENRGYPNRIMLKLMPDYVTAGYSRDLDCPRP